MTLCKSCTEWPGTIVSKFCLSKLKWIANLQKSPNNCNGQQFANLAKKMIQSKNLCNKTLHRIESGKKCNCWSPHCYDDQNHHIITFLVISILHSCKRSNRRRCWPVNFDYFIGQLSSDCLLWQKFFSECLSGESLEVGDGILVYISHALFIKVQ